MSGRPSTPPRVEGTTTTITVKRCCSSCGRELGDATDAELDAAIEGRPLPDVTAECGCRVTALVPVPRPTPAKPERGWCARCDGRAERDPAGRWWWHLGSTCALPLLAPGAFARCGGCDPVMLRLGPRRLDGLVYLCPTCRVHAVRALDRLRGFRPGGRVHAEVFTHGGVLPGVPLAMVAEAYELGRRRGR